MFEWLQKLFSFGGDEKVAPAPVAKKASGGFVDSETGKTYKTAGSLKAAQTRRKNKGKKKAKKSKK